MWPAWFMAQVKRRSNYQRCAPATRHDAQGSVTLSIVKIMLGACGLALDYIGVAIGHRFQPGQAGFGTPKLVVTDISEPCVWWCNLVSVIHTMFSGNCVGRIRVETASV
jgi:hypothetical protein